jgi:transglutaminase superfamily protein
MSSLAVLLCGAGVAWSAAGDQQRADPMSDAPEQRAAVSGGGAPAVASYAEALRTWRSAEDLNAWLDERFEYDTARALRLSETQRARSGSLPIHEPRAFFASPRGVCVDVARFAVESLRVIDPQAKAGYLMIEFNPATLSGQTLRRHWVATFERDGQLYVFGDSKRPGHLAGPYADAAAFTADYARYRGREVVAFRLLPTFERQRRQLANKQAREATQP